MYFNIFFGVFRKINIFWGMKILSISFLGSSKNWTIFKGHFYAFLGLLLRSRYKMGDIFLGAKISNIFLGCLKFLIFFRGVKGRCLARAYV